MAINMIQAVQADSYIHLRAESASIPFVRYFKLSIISYAKVSLVSRKSSLHISMPLLQLHLSMEASNVLCLHAH